MRTGKRLLAGAAAGALAAGLISFVGASPATATVASIAMKYPSMTTVATGVNAATALRVPINFTSPTGAALTTGTFADDTQGLQVTITAPVTAYDDTALEVKTTAVSAGRNIQVATVADALTLSVLPGGGKNWQDLLVSATDGVGTYTITARLFNIGNGSTIATTSMPLTVTSAFSAPAASIAYVSAPAFKQATPVVNVLNNLGATTGKRNSSNLASTVSPDGFGIWVTDSLGGPYVLPSGTPPTVESASGSGITWTATGGFGNNFAPTELRLYNAGTASAVWGAPGTTSIRTSVTLASVLKGSGQLPVSVAGGQTATPALYLNTTPNFEDASSTTTTPVYEVTPGTTSLSFTVLTDANLDDTTVAFNVWSSANLGSSAPSGGNIRMFADASTLTLTVNAAAAVAGNTLTISSGANAVTATPQFIVEFVAPAATLDATAPIAKVGAAAAVPGTIQTQYGDPLPGTWTVSLRAQGANCTTSTVLASATANAAGVFALEAPASASPSVPTDRDFTLCATNGVQVVGPTTTSVTYTATGGVNSLTLSTPSTYSGVSATVRPLLKTPAAGTAILQQGTATWNGTSTVSASTLRGSTVGQAIQLAATVSPAGTRVTFTGDEGVLFTDRTAGSVFYQDASSSVTVTSDGSGVAEVWALSTKPGLKTVTVSAGTTTATYTFHVMVPPNAARTLSITPTSATLAPNAFRSIEAQVKDIFGNNVPRYEGLYATLLGGGSLAGSFITQTVIAPATNADGKTEVFYTAPAGTGTSQIRFEGSTDPSQTSNVWVTGAIPGAPDSVRTGLADITVGGSATKSIVIVGERATVSGKPGIVVEGSTNGFNVGTKMVPSIRFPGETGFTAGSARPTTSIAGDFSWQRKTGKKTSVRFTNEAGDVRSNTIIIAAN